MILTINGKNYELTFGLGFLAQMNKQKPTEIEGMKTGYGAMALLNIGKALGDPLALYDLIKAATAEASQKPSNQELEAYLTQLVLEERLDNVFDDIMSEVKKSPLLVYAMKIQGDQAPQLTTIDTPTATDISTPMQTVSPY